MNHLIKLIIDAGHGWFTKGKESMFHRITKGMFKGQPIIRENNVNEAVCNKLSVLYDNSHFITNEWQDVNLDERVRREHALYEKGNSLFLSIHADAYREKDKADGGTIFYYSETGRQVASYITKELIRMGYPIRMRMPKKGNYKVLRETKSISILFELAFMTTKSNVDKMMSEDYRNLTAKMLNNIIRKMPKELLS
jgi:N-acetylmuramoyl-L-alanine amidase